VVGCGASELLWSFLLHELFMQTKMLNILVVIDTVAQDVVHLGGQPSSHSEGAPVVGADARWRQIADYLRTDVLDGRWQPGQALPGENQLAEDYATSRPTVRLAIAALVNEGLLTVAHGRGTFIRPRPDRRTILIAGADHHDLLADPTCQGWQRVLPEVYAKAGGVDGNWWNPASRDDAEALGIRTGALTRYRIAFWRHRKLRSTLQLTSAIPADLFDATDRERIDDLEADPAGLYGYLAARRGPVRWHTTVTARMPAGSQMEAMGMEVGTPLLQISRTMLGIDGRPIEVTEIQGPADRFEAVSAHEEPDSLGDGLIVLRL